MAIVFAAACDPGWGYTVPGGKEIHTDVSRYEVAGPDDVTLRARANLFTGSLHTEVWLTNLGTTPVEVRPDGVRVLTRFGMPLPLQRPVKCRDRDGNEQEADVVALAAGDTCELLADFSEQPDEVELKFITWMQTGSGETVDRFR